MSERLEQYYKYLDGWMAYYGFTPLAIPVDSGLERFYKMTRMEASKFGKNDRYVGVKFMPNVSINDYKESAFKVYGVSRIDRQFKGILGFGSMMTTYPLLITENISTELASFAKSYSPLRSRATVEFPSVLDLTSTNLFYSQKTPIWGALYYAGFRREVYSYFSPSSWKEMSGSINKT